MSAARGNERLIPAPERHSARNSGQPRKLDNATVASHINGDITINLYSTNPETQRSKWVAIDADYDGCMKDLLQLRYELKQDEIRIPPDSRPTPYKEIIGSLLSHG